MSGTAHVDAPAVTPAAAPDDAAEAWRLMRELFLASRPRFLATLQDVGLSPGQGMALLHMSPGEPLTMSALATALKCDNSNVTGIVDRLEAAGLVERRSAPHDRRVKTVVVTRQGERLRAEADRRLRVPPPSIAGLAAEDARALREILERASAG